MKYLTNSMQIYGHSIMAAMIAAQTVSIRWPMEGEREILDRIHRLPDRANNEFAANCAWNVLGIFKTVYPDDRRVEMAVSAALRRAQNHITRASLSAACSGARDAMSDCKDSAARYAATSAVEASANATASARAVLASRAAVRAVEAYAATTMAANLWTLASEITMFTVRSKHREIQLEDLKRYATAD